MEEQRIAEWKEYRNVINQRTTDGLLFSLDDSNPIHEFWFVSSQLVANTSFEISLEFVMEHSTQHTRAVFVIPNHDEAISDYEKEFEDLGIEICIVVFNKTGPSACENLFAEVMCDWGSNLQYVFYPPLDFCDQWVRDTSMSAQPGSVADFIKCFDEAGIPTAIEEMYWDGPWQSTVCLMPYRLDAIKRLLRPGGIPSKLERQRVR